jgi:hypothetical protein
LGVPLLRRVGVLRASLRSVLRTLRPYIHLTQKYFLQLKITLPFLLFYNSVFW